MPGEKMTAFRYHYAVISRVPNSFRDECIRSNKEQAIDMDRARHQLENFTETLRKLGVDVLELPADERHPNCVFTADTAVVINGSALICRPSSSRRGEEAVIRQTLKKDLGLKIVEIENEKAFVEGGDVLWTGKEIFVGLSSRTNFQGAQAVANAFPEYPTSIIKIPQGGVHLQSYVSVIAQDVLTVGKSEIALKMLKEIMGHASFNYKVVHLEEDAAANVLFINGRIVHQDPNDIPKSFPIFESKFDNRVAIKMSEFLKADGPLTSCCLLVSKMKTLKMFPTTLEKGQHEID